MCDDQCDRLDAIIKEGAKAQNQLLEGLGEGKGNRGYEGLLLNEKRILSFYVNENITRRIYVHAPRNFH